MSTHTYKNLSEGVCTPWNGNTGEGSAVERTLLKGGRIQTRTAPLSEGRCSFSTAKALARMRETVGEGVAKVFSAVKSEHLDTDRKVVQHSNFHSRNYQRN